MSEPGSVFDDAAARVRPVDAGAATRAQAHQNQLTKPPGSLGRLEAAGAQLAAIARHAPPPVPNLPWSRSSPATTVCWPKVCPPGRRR